MLKRRKPRTPGQRHTVRRKLDTEGGIQTLPLSLRKGKRQKSGRNQRGRITVRHRGGGKKRLLRTLRSNQSYQDYLGFSSTSSTSSTKAEKRASVHSEKHLNLNQKEMKGKVIGIQYDPNRTARLALVQDLIDSRKWGYVLAAEGLKVGDSVKYTWSAKNGVGQTFHQESQGRQGQRELNPVNLESSDQTSHLSKLKDFDQKFTGVTGSSSPSESIRGSTRKLRYIPIGSSVFNIELQPGHGGKYVRTAGSFATLLRKPEEKALLRLPSGTRIEVSLECTATLGRVGGEEHRIEVMGKAGRMRNKGWRPTVRGEAMNPIDHPHGGRTRGGRPEITPWGRLAKGQSTRNSKKKSPWVVVKGE